MLEQILKKKSEKEIMKGIIAKKGRPTGPVGTKEEPITEEMYKEVVVIKRPPLSKPKTYKGLSKNYITLSRDGNGVKVTRKGIFKKRNRSWLEKTFVEEFLLLQF